MLRLKIGMQKNPFPEEKYLGGFRVCKMQTVWAYHVYIIILLLLNPSEFGLRRFIANVSQNYFCATMCILSRTPTHRCCCMDAGVGINMYIYMYVRAQIYC